MGRLLLELRTRLVFGVNSPDGWVRCNRDYLAHRIGKSTDTVDRRLQIIRAHGLVDYRRIQDSSIDTPIDLRLTDALLIGNITLPDRPKRGRPRKESTP